jgi:hypothetical protein
MSTDWDVVCYTCKLYTHLGQRFTTGPTFGFGTNDPQGRLIAAEFIAEHVGHDLRINLDAPEGFANTTMKENTT